MSRRARVISRSGIYHVMLRGIDKREIFLKKEDYEKFLYYISKAKEKSICSLLAYCLMNNHVHLLIKEGQEEIGDTVKRIAVGYVQYHNKEYERTGHLFQNRYCSEPVEDEKYLITVIRYIHQNPINAGIASNIHYYKWSSLHDYLSDDTQLIDREIPLSYWKNKQDFIEYNCRSCNEECLDYKTNSRYTDSALTEMIKEIIDINDLKTIEIQLRNKMLKKIKDQSGASLRQLERVLGIGKSVIQRV